MRENNSVRALYRVAKSGRFVTVCKPMLGNCDRCGELHDSKVKMSIVRCGVVDMQAVDTDDVDMRQSVTCVEQFPRKALGN